MESAVKYYVREFIKGVKVGKWIETNPNFKTGENATNRMLIDGSGYYIDDPENEKMYFIDYNQH